MLDVLVMAGEQDEAGAADHEARRAEADAALAERKVLKHLRDAVGAHEGEKGRAGEGMEGENW